MPGKSVTRKDKERKLGDFFFIYSWQELGAVRHLRNTWAGIYIGLAIVGYALAPLGTSGVSAIALGALACYPAYLLGLRSQRTADPLALNREALMVWRIGLVAKVFTAAGTLLLVGHLISQ